MPKEKPLTDDQVRAMRDRCYGDLSTNSNWNACREHWMKPENVRWLQEMTKPREK